MSTHNDITGDAIRSKPTTDAYRNNPFWDEVERKKKLDKEKAEAENGSCRQNSKG